MTKAISAALTAAALLSPHILFATSPTGDTQGKVSDVYLRPVTNGEHKLRVYFSIVENDRWNCLSSQGYIDVTDASPYVSTEQFKMILSMALTAQTTGKSLSIDSPGVDPCSSGNSARLVSG